MNPFERRGTNDIHHHILFDAEKYFILFEYY